MFRSVLLLFYFFCLSNLQGQLSQAELLLSFEMEYFAPIELEIGSIGKGKLGEFRYYMGVEIKESNTLALVSFLPDSGDITPHVNVPAKIATLATNDEEYKISMISPSSDDRALLGADWVAHAMFSPKIGTGRYENAKLTSLFREGVGLVYIYYLYDDELVVGDMFRFMDI